MEKDKRTLPGGVKQFKYRNECVKITIAYLICGVLWIYFSDRLAYFFASSPTVFLAINTYKGWFYVIATAMMLYGLIRNLLKKIEMGEQENTYLSYFDVLTGMHNRRYYEMQMEVLDCKEKLPISVIMADVNGLKIVNDAFGHQLGDELLRKAAKAVQDSCRPDDLNARWGGDEFVVLLPNTSYEEAEEIVSKIKEKCSHESVNMVRVSMSLGWATKTESEESFSEVLKKAENDMYQHKIIQNEGLRGNIINIIVSTLYEKNPREEAHSERVGEFAVVIGRAFGCSEIVLAKLRAMGHLHDIGKIAVEDEILNKAGTLTEEEQAEIKRHPEVGYRILSATNEMLPLADCVLAHHERWDGNGYPKGLKGEEIPLEARIITLADSYDAMSSERPYRKALDEVVILHEIRRNAGKQFDPEISRVFVENVLKKAWIE